MEIRSRFKQREMVMERMERCHLKQRISKVLRASLRSSCGITPRDATAAVQEPVLVPRLYDQGNKEQHTFQSLHLSLLPLRSQQSRLSTHRREMTAGDHLWQPADFGGCQPTFVTRKPKKKSMKKDRNVSNGGGRTCPPGSPAFPSYYSFEQMREELERGGRRIAAKKKKVMEENRVKKKKLLSNSYGFTSSSSEDSDNDDVEVLFGSDETETLFSSWSFSSDSSEVYYLSSCRCRRRRKKKKKKTPQRLRRQQKPREEDGEQRRHCSTCGDGFRPLVSISSSSTYFFGAEKTQEGMAAEVMEEEEEMEAGFAVEKQSSDPREDFRSSMLEMIMEKQVFGARDLESLLLRYLSLNSPHNHSIILEVFSEIRETLFCQ